MIEAARLRVVAALAMRFRDLDLAEDAFGDACVAYAALAPVARPADAAAWLYVVARRRALDRLRKAGVEARAMRDAGTISEQEDTGHQVADVIPFPDPIPDERLRLIFIACHPALAVEARIALALRHVCGVPVEQLAALFLTSPATLYQRLARAKAKIRNAGIAFETPPRRHWPERLAAVLATIELGHTLAYQDAENRLGAAIGAEIARLASVLAELLPDEPEVLALAALVTLTEARRSARIDAAGRMVPLSRQDPAQWDRTRIGAGAALLDRAGAFGRGGPVQLLAAIQLAHCRRAFGEAADPERIAALYDGLYALRPTPVVALHRVLARRPLVGDAATLAALDALAGSEGAPLDCYRPFHAARADVLAALGQRDAARAAYDAALACAPSPAERRYLEEARAALG